MQREIIYADVTAFVVTVERMLHPELRARPVVISPMGTPRAVVTALSREAWESGIRKGMLLSKARRCCRDAVVLPPNEPLYARASNALCRVLSEFSPMLEPSGYGRAYVDITGTARLFGPPRDAAWRAQREIRQRLRLEASFGVAANKMVSRMAAAVTEPAGLQDVQPGDERAFVSPLSVRMLPGVGPRTLEQLSELNIGVIRELAEIRVEHLALAFGRHGFVLHQRALGIDDTPVCPPMAAPAVEQEKTLVEDTNDVPALKRCLSQLCEAAAGRLRAGGLRAGRLELRARYSDYREDIGRERLGSPTQSTGVMQAHAHALLDRVVARRTRVRSLRLRLTELTDGPAQLELFKNVKTERRLRLESALDALKMRGG